MEQLIRFRSLSDELNDNEYNQFVQKAITSKGRHFINTLLFNAYKNASNDESITSFTDIITNIINSRESKSNEQISYNKLDKLPSELLGECSSFLETRDYFKFSKVNRKIYTSINSPSRIYQLSLYLFNKHPATLNMKRFKNVEKLGISVKKFNNSLSASNRSIWETNIIKELNIYYYDDVSSSRKEMDIFMHYKHINYDNITRLKLEIPRSIMYDPPSFLYLLCRFPMLEYLEIEAMGLRGDDTLFTQNNIRMAFQKLKGLSVDCYFDPHLMTKLINALSNQLHALSISNINENIIVTPHAFPKLKELQLIYPTMKIVDSFKNVTTIESAQILHCDSDKDNIEIVTKFIERMVKNQLSLKQLQVHSDVNMEMAMETTEAALFWSKNKKRKSHKLFIEFKQINYWKNKRTKKMHFGIIRLINSLEMIKIENWRIKIQFSTELNIRQDDKEQDDTEEMKELLNELESLKQNYQIHIERSKGTWTRKFMFIISNKECKICGYQQNYCFL